ncbi:hypothetical protein [Shewanella baltica]|uniref:hypothetical protein n=1 Tax=Shewanella baltica TaxID=62322 RepID=UPI00217D212C|nr:hypothetical protein [Shewanella baltica]
MQLGWFSRTKSKSSLVLDVVPLKKIIAVSDAYWNELYQPMINIVVASINVFEKQNSRILNDYQDQFVRIIRRSKGAVQGEPMLAHLQTYCLALAFSSLYVARLCSEFDFISVSKSKKSIGERNAYFPWLDSSENVEIKIKRASRVLPVYVLAYSILNQSIGSVGWRWLHSQLGILKGLWDSIQSNGESGIFAGLLADMQSIPLDRHNLYQATNEQYSVPKVAAEPKKVSEEPSSSSSLDDLIMGLGGDNSELAFEDLFADKAKSSKSEDTINEKSSELDLSIFESDEPQPQPQPQPQKTDPDFNSESELQVNDLDPIPSDTGSSDDVLNEFQNFLANCSTTEQPVISDNYNSSTITGDLIKWATTIISDNIPTDFIFVVEFDEGYNLAIDKEEGILAFVKSDYDLDSEEAYNAVKEEVLTDLSMSSEWIENFEGGDEWKLINKGETKKVILLKKCLTSSYLTPNCFLSE